VLIVSAACWVENLDRALYSIISCVTPLLMALHLALTGRMISLSELASFVPISLLYIGIPMSVCLHRYFSPITATSPQTRTPQSSGAPCMRLLGG
jgi:hypothetical protein